MYDLIIRRGRLIDGTGAPWFRGDVAIRDGRIAAIGRLDGTAAAQTVDAAGRFVTPGFVDIHTHSDFTLLLDGRASSTLAQGITTQIVGNCGVSAAPVLEGAPYFGPLDPTMHRGLSYDWEDVAGYFERQSQGVGANVAALVGHGSIRYAAMGEGKHHPRSYGAVPYFLRRCVREQQVLSWEAAVHKLTGYGAARFRLAGRGLLREGMAADITVFDPQTVGERATFDAPYQYPAGIEWVLVNDRTAVAAGQLQDALGGQVLRRAA